MTSKLLPVFIAFVFTLAQLQVPWDNKSHPAIGRR
jgi:hypothetical protein